MARNSVMVRGRLRQSASRDVSYITINAETPCSREILRRHSRMHSRSSCSSLETKTGSVVAGLSTMIEERLLRLRGLEPETGTFIHSGREPQTSHAPQVFHFGVSPKCIQIWR